MANSYTAIKAPQYGTGMGLYQKAEVATPDDDNDLATYARIMATADGDVCFLPARNDDGDTITMTLKSGEVVPFLVRRLMATGTTASCLSVGSLFGAT